MPEARPRRGSGWMKCRRWSSLGWVYAGDLVVMTDLAVSFPVAVATRSPGCELGAIHWLIARRRGKTYARRGPAARWVLTASIGGRPHGGGACRTRSGHDQADESAPRAPDRPSSDDARALPFRDSCFAGVALLYVIYHFASLASHWLLRRGRGSRVGCARARNCGLARRCATTRSAKRCRGVGERSLRISSSTHHFRPQAGALVFAHNA